jgi:hypothetical protein
MTRIEINPNLRLPGGLTVADLDDDVHGSLDRLHQEVDVFESASGLHGVAWVMGVDEEERTVTLLVDWGRLSLPDNTNRTVANFAGAAANFVLRPPSSAYDGVTAA